MIAVLPTSKDDAAFLHYSVSLKDTVKSSLHGDNSLVGTPVSQATVLIVGSLVFLIKDSPLNYRDLYVRLH